MNEPSWRMTDDRPPEPGPGQCWECPIRDGRLVCDPVVSRRCPLNERDKPTEESA